MQVAMSRLVNRANASAFLPQVKAPVLGLYPTSGQITSDTQESLLKDNLSDFEVIHLPTNFHMVQLLYPKTCAEHVLRFCARHDGVSLEDL
ncbi:MAG: hypothetical protein L0Y45_03030 [Woeseiaceae bacterium]|nr:hypothetical protein [Woeseiaceae bacterium]